MKTSVYALAGIAAISFFAGCATTTDADSTSMPTGSSGDTEMLRAEPACFNARAATNFSALSNTHVYVQGRQDQHYLLTMFNGCFGLRSASGIALSSDLSRICSNTSATIYYRDFGRLEACRVRDVESVAGRDAAREIVQLRRASR
jgi:hypothetical protein